MQAHQLNWIANFILVIADDVLHGLYVCGRFRDLILAMRNLKEILAVRKEIEGLPEEIIREHNPRRNTP